MSNAEKGLPLFLALDALPEAYVTEAELPEKPDKKPSLWERINTNGWIAAAIGLVVALGVVTLIVLAGRGAGGPGVAGTSAPVIPEDAPYVFAFEDQVAIPIEGMWWYSGKTSDGAFVDADGFGLSPNLLTMDDPPTIALRAEDAARLQFICRAGETPGEVNLWDTDGEYLSNGHDFSFLTDALRGKPGIYYVTVNIARRTDAGSGEYTEGIRLIVSSNESTDTSGEAETTPALTGDEPYLFVYRDQTARPLEGLLWATDGTTSASGDGLPDAVLNDQSILPTIRADAEDVSDLQFVIRTGHTPGTIRLYTIDGSRMLASGSDFSFLPAYLAQQPDGGTGAYFLTVEVHYNDGTYSGCMTEGICLVIGKDGERASLIQNNDEALVRYLQENLINADYACIKDKKLCLQLHHPACFNITDDELGPEAMLIEENARLERLVTSKESPYTVDTIAEWVVGADSSVTRLDDRPLRRQTSDTTDGRQLSYDVLENAVSTVLSSYEGFRLTWRYQDGKLDIAMHTDDAVTGAPFDKGQAEAACGKIADLTKGAVSVVTISVFTADERGILSSGYRLSAYCLYDREMGRFSAIGDFVK